MKILILSWFTFVVITILCFVIGRTLSIKEQTKVLTCGEYPIRFEIVGVLWFLSIIECVVYTFIFILTY